MVKKSPNSWINWLLTTGIGAVAALLLIGTAVLAWPEKAHDAGVEDGKREQRLIALEGEMKEVRWRLDYRLGPAESDHAAARHTAYPATRPALALKEHH